MRGNNDDAIYAPLLKRFNHRNFALSVILRSTDKHVEAGFKSLLLHALYDPSHERVGNCREYHADCPGLVRRQALCHSAGNIVHLAREFLNPFASGGSNTRMIFSARETVDGETPAILAMS